jgi:hypothetical protein
MSKMIRATLLALVVATLPALVVATLPVSGPISLSAVQTEFGGAAPISLSEYYKGGAYVATTENAPNVPTSGPISLWQFYGAANAAAPPPVISPSNLNCSCVSLSSCSCTTNSASCTGGNGGSVSWTLVSGTHTANYPGSYSTSFDSPTVTTSGDLTDDTCAGRFSTFRCTRGGVQSSNTLSVSSDHCRTN